MQLFIPGIIIFIGLIIIFQIILKLLTPIDERLKLKRQDIIIAIITMIFCIGALYFKYNTNLLFFAYTYLAFYLCLTAYVDKKTSDVYCIFNYISLAIGAVFFIYRFLTVLNRPVVLFALLLISFMLILAKIMHLYGEGDGEIFFVISIFLLAGDSGMNGLFHVYMTYALALVIITLTHLNEIDWKKKKFKKPIPFAPSIFAATMIMILII